MGPQSAHYAGPAGVLAALLTMALVLPGCPGGTTSRPPRSLSDSSTAAHLSLTDIGERAVDTGERLEEEGLYQGALEAYQRALWAFACHQRLTGRTPLLIEHARDAVARLSQRAQSE